MEARLAALDRRVEDLERQVRTHPTRASRSRLDGLGADLALLERLRARDGRRYRGRRMRGAVAYGGAVVFGEREYLWMREHPLPELASLEPSRLAQALATLGHPARLVLLRALLQQARTRRDLQALLGVPSPGQLYHHLKELLAAGIVTQTRRGHYEITERRVVPVLAALAAVSDLVETTGAAPALVPAAEEE
jgi:DNA-binding transcriptional ArsR family regulator